MSDLPSDNAAKKWDLKRKYRSISLALTRGSNLRAIFARQKQVICFKQICRPIVRYPLTPIKTRQAAKVSAIADVPVYKDQEWFKNLHCEAGKVKLENNKLAPIYENEVMQQNEPNFYWMYDTEVAILDPDRDDSYLVPQLSAQIYQQNPAENYCWQSEEILNLVLETTQISTWDWNIVTNRITWSNNSELLFGINSATWQEKTFEHFLQLIHPGDRQCVTQAVRRSIQENITFENQFRIVGAKGNIYGINAKGKVFYEPSGRAVRMIGICTNISNPNQTQKLTEEIQHDALHDRLTNLANRSSFITQLDQIFTQSKQQPGSRFAVLLIDLDRFKVINDALGHFKADRLLVAIASRLSACIHPKNTIARFGGDEFAILVNHIKDISSATNIADKIKQELAKPFYINGEQIFITASIGIAPSSLSYERTEQFLQDANFAMERAKAKGKSCYEVFNAETYSKTVALLQLETDLWKAIKRQEFQLHYQPIFSLQNSTLLGFEALVRWNHPQQGMVSPAEFIPIAEETGLIIPLSQWVLREACCQMKIWQEQFPSNSFVSMNVNISVKQLLEPDFIEQVKQILKETGLNSQFLKLEITESILIGNKDYVISILSQLKTLGVQLHIDDFGTGYSSLSYLHCLPIDTLKIDRSFISRIGANGENTEIVKTIVTLAHNLGMTVTAEGIETIDQLMQLKAMQCDYGQGYFFSKPVSSEVAAGLF